MGFHNTGRFIMFSVITNIYNKKTKGPILMELFTATGKLKKFFCLTARDVQCVHNGWLGTHRYDSQVLAPHTRQHVDTCLATTWSLYRCVPYQPWNTHRTSLVVKKNFFSFPVTVSNSIKVGPLVFLLEMFVIRENIMKRSVLILWMMICTINSKFYVGLHIMLLSVYDFHENARR